MHIIFFHVRSSNYTSVGTFSFLTRRFSLAMKSSSVLPFYVPICCDNGAQ